MKNVKECTEAASRDPLDNKICFPRPPYLGLFWAANQHTEKGRYFQCHCQHLSLLETPFPLKKPPDPLLGSMQTKTKKCLLPLWWVAESAISEFTLLRADYGNTTAFKCFWSPAVF